MCVKHATEILSPHIFSVYDLQRMVPYIIQRETDYTVGANGMLYLSEGTMSQNFETPLPNIYPSQEEMSYGRSPEVNWRSRSPYRASQRLDSFMGVLQQSINQNRGTMVGGFASEIYRYLLSGEEAGTPTTVGPSDGGTPVMEINSQFGSDQEPSFETESSRTPTSPLLNRFNRLWENENRTEYSILPRDG